MTVRARAFTLIEAMVALAITALVIATTTGAVMNINKQIAETNRRVELQDEAKRVGEYITAKVQGAGGGQVRPHHSVFVEDAQLGGTTVYACHAITGLPTACGSETNDRFIVATPDSTFTSCAMTSGTATTSDGADGCTCITNTWLNKQVLITDSATNGVGFASAFVTGVNVGTCTLTVSAGQASMVTTLTSATVTYPATATVVNVETFFVDRSGTNHHLKRWVDTDGNLTAAAGELRTVDDRTYGMQVAVAYDGLPEDGSVDDLTNTTDEWLFNAASDPLPGAGAWATVSPRQLRMVHIALAIGVVSQIRGGNSVQMLNGPSITAVTTPPTFLMTTSDKAFLRNLNVFTQ